MLIKTQHFQINIFYPKIAIDLDVIKSHINLYVNDFSFH